MIIIIMMFFALCISVYAYNLNSNNTYFVYIFFILAFYNISISHQGIDEIDWIIQFPLSLSLAPATVSYWVQ